jgi:glutathione synthase/RimK-type ligase-like ATP-grasp enzyme
MIQLMCARLRAMRLEYLVLDEHDIQRGRSQLTISHNGAYLEGTITVSGRTLSLCDFTGVYARYVSYADQLDEHDLSKVDAFASLCEIQALLVALLDALPSRVVNRPSASKTNDSKPFQQRIIQNHGFLTPRTLVTTSPSSARQFYESCHRAVIYKSTSGIRSIVQRLTAGDLDRLSDVSTCPTQFQEFVPGIDYRVHTVGDEFFATRVQSSATDYRYAPREGCRVSVLAADIPSDVSDRCLRMASAMSLPLAGIDLRHGEDGQWYCFEVNPSPGFIYYERGAQQLISEALARLLCNRRC